MVVLSLMLEILAIDIWYYISKPYSINDYYCQVFVILHQLRTFILEGSIPDAPSLKQTNEKVQRPKTGRIGVQMTVVKRDTEIDLSKIPLTLHLYFYFEYRRLVLCYLLVFRLG